MLKQMGVIMMTRYSGETVLGGPIIGVFTFVVPLIISRADCFNHHGVVLC